MGDKEQSLSIIIRTVDHATAGIQAVNKRLDALTRPTREFGKALGELREKSGFDAVADGFKGVGSAVSDLVSNVVGKVAIIGGALAVAVTGVLSMVDHFDQLGDTAERLGTSADFLAAFRYAAERAGAPLEGVDEALQTLVTNMGAAKAGTGKMLKFLNEISPVLARQVTGAHSLEEALGLLADAEAKLPDAARRAKLAQATLGDPALAPLLARGSAGIQELLTKYYALAGAQGEAADVAGKTDDALKDLHASTDGVKAAIVTGLAPALTVIIGQMTEWLVGHRSDVAQWANDIGKKLPEAVDEIVKSIKGGIKWASDFLDTIGGWKVAALGVAAVMTGPLVGAIATLAAALLTTPVGVVVTGLAAIAAGIVAITSETRAFKSFADQLADRKAHPPPEETDEERRAEAERNTREQARREAYARVTGKSMDTIAYEVSTRPTGEMDKEFQRAREIEEEQYRRDHPDRLPPLPPKGPQEVAIKVHFENAPKGMRAAVAAAGGTFVDMTTGYQMGTP